MAMGIIGDRNHRGQVHWLTISGAKLRNATKLVPTGHAGHGDRYIGSLFRGDGPVPMILKSFFTKYFGFANDKFND